MKILHTADLHLGAPMRARLSAREGRLRRDELLSSFLGLLKTARAEGCAAVIIAGDLFDTEAAAASLSSAVIDTVKSFSDIDFYYARGNHEGDARFCAAVPKNLHIFGKEIEYFEKENIVFFGKEAINYNDFDNIRLQENKINIMIAHGAWADGYNKSADIPLGFLRGRRIDYCALGHYHSYAQKRIDERGIAVYAGTPEGRGFDEIGPKGAVLIEADENGITHRFLPLARRTLHRIEADISEAKSLLEVFSLCENALKSAGKNDLVRLLLVGKRKHLPAIDTLAVLRSFQTQFYYLEVEDRSTDAPDVEKYKSESSLQGEFVRTVCEDAALSNEERMRILNLGLAALRAEIGGGAR